MPYEQRTLHICFYLIIYVFSFASIAFLMQERCTQIGKNRFVFLPKGIYIFIYLYIHRYYLGMARRERVPRLKSHRKKKNKNPKLSPFQREQQRLKLANQPPIVKPGQRDAPKSQRLVLEYLEEKRKRKELKREEMKRNAREREQGTSSEPKEGVPQNFTRGIGSSAKSSAERHPKNSIQEAASHDESRGGKASSLNALLASSLVPGTGPTTSLSSSSQGGETPSVALIIARKKAKKHEKRVKMRQERVKDQVEKMTKELEMLTRKKGRRKKEVGENAAWEKKLRQMQREKEIEERKKKKMEKKGKSAARGEEFILPAELLAGMLSDAKKTTTGEIKENHSLSGKSCQGTGRSASNKKLVESSTNEESGSGASENAFLGERKGANKSVTRYSKNSHKNDDGSPTPVAVSSSSASGGTALSSELPSRKRARDFCDLVDVVHFNERVEGPPVFTCVPNLSASVSRLAKKLEDQGKEKKKKNTPMRQSLFSDLGGLGEQKRLTRLGLLPASFAVAGSSIASADVSSGTKVPK